MNQLPNAVDYKKAFENAIVELCHAIGKDEIKKLDRILIQEKPELEIFKDIIISFSQFKIIFSKEIKKN